MTSCACMSCQKAFRPFEPLGRWRRHRGIALQPVEHGIEIELLAPQEPREGARLHELHVLGKTGIQRLVKRRSLGLAIGERPLVAVAKRIGHRGIRKTKLHLKGRAGLDRGAVHGCRLGAGVRRIHHILSAVDDVLVKRVLHVGRRVRRVVQPRIIRLVVGEKILLSTLAIEAMGWFLPRIGDDRVIRAEVHLGLRRAFLSPRPRVAEPQGGEDRQRRGIRPPIDRADTDANILRPRLCVLNIDIEVAALVENPGVDEFILGLLPRAAPIDPDEFLIGKLRLWVLVEPAHEAVRGRVVEVVEVILDVLAVITLRIREPERALLEDVVLPVPKRRSETQAAVAIADAEQSVLAPTVNTRAGVVVWEIAPCIAIGRVILADSAPLAVAKKGTPMFPVLPFLIPCGDAFLLGVFEHLLPSARKRGQCHCRFGEITPCACGGKR